MHQLLSIIKGATQTLAETIGDAELFALDAAISITIKEAKERWMKTKVIILRVSSQARLVFLVKNANDLGQNQVLFLDLFVSMQLLLATRPFQSFGT